jgi:hypothetical protein
LVIIRPLGNETVKNLKFVAALILVLALGGEWLWRQNQDASLEMQPTSAGVPEVIENPEILRLYQQQLSDVWVTGWGEVARLLADDNKGSRHQRFLIRVNPSQTLLVAHNIDLAKPVAHLKIGDRIEFRGEYEWNKKGGVLHWTHHDPSGRKQPAGWIKHNKILYE